MADPHGNRQPAHASEEKKNTPISRNNRDKDFPRLDSIHLDRLLKQTLKENNVKKQVTKITPNLSNSRKRKTVSPSFNTEQEASTSNGQLPSDEWTKPKRPVKRRSSAFATDNKNPIQHDNKFLSLSDNSDMEEDTLTDDETNIPRTIISKRHKPPPLYITKSSMKDIISIMNALELTKKDITILESNANEILTHTIYANNQEHHTKIREALGAKKLEFFTYTPKNEKPKSLILKGVKGYFSAEDIKSELIELALPGVEILSVKNFHYDKNQIDKHHHIIQLSSNSPTADLFKIKTLAYQRVKWEKLRKPLIYQCRRCQRVGHSSKNCHLEFRCVKCAQAHGPGKCAINKAGGKELLTCSNCGQTGHPASYRGCPYIKLALGIKRSQQRYSQAATQRKIDRATTSTQANYSFAQALKSTQAPRLPLPTRINTTAPPLQPTSTRFTEVPTTARYSYNIQQDKSNQFTPEQQPSWLNELKSDLATIITDQLKSISTQVATNTAKIEFIFNSLYHD